jgi:hypothetical protein
VARFDRAVPPGGSGKIVLSLDAAKVHGAFTKTATVRSNDSAKANVQLTIKGTVRRYVELQPERLFLRGHKGDPLQASVRVKTTLPEPLRVKVEGTTGLDGKVDCEITTIQEDKEYELKVVNRAGLGRYNGKVRLTTNFAKKPVVEVPVYGDITGDIGFYPASLEMGRLSTATKGEVGRVITVWKNQGEDFQVGPVTYDKDRFEVEVKQQGSRFMVYVRPRLDNLKPGEFRSQVSIQTTSADLPVLVVPLHGWVQ